MCCFRFAPISLAKIVLGYMPSTIEDMYEDVKIYGYSQMDLILAVLCTKIMAEKRHVISTVSSLFEPSIIGWIVSCLKNTCYFSDAT